MSANLPDWVLATAFVAVVLIALFGVAWLNTQRQIAQTASKRPNPTEAEFMSAMMPGVSDEAAAFLWETALLYVGPRLTPHPDDDLVSDLPIDDEEWSMDWPRAFADQQGFDENAYSDWPEGWPVTIRNYGKWLDTGSCVVC